MCDEGRFDEPLPSIPKSAPKGKRQPVRFAIDQDFFRAGFLPDQI